MIYKIKEDKQSGNFIIWKRKGKYWDPYALRHFDSPSERITELKAKRILQFDDALLVDDGKKYSLYLPSFPIHPTLLFIIGDISQYRVSYFNIHKDDEIIKVCTLALNINDFWTFLIPSYFQYDIEYSNDMKVLTERIKNLPKLFVTDSTLPAYFKKGFENTGACVFHANGKDNAIIREVLSCGAIGDQVEITESTEITPLSPRNYFKMVNEKGECLFRGPFLVGQYAKVENFAKEDYPEIFQSHIGYWGKDADGNIIGLHIIDLHKRSRYDMLLEKTAKSVHFYSRTYIDRSGHYYDIWQITNSDGRKELKLETYVDRTIPKIVIDEDAWNF